ncbi:MAG: hypothetical protein K9H49_06790 [Bacteroidales bacterium]|nr:hypothetical protein [Bacteroidales bacterium]MCF8390981.1 hypothetical protein [Bacteroidales bacterium]
MRDYFKIYIYLLFMYLGLSFSGYFILKKIDISLIFSQLSTLLTGALIISFISTTIFLKGLSLSKSKNVIATLLAIVLKFLLFIALIGIYAVLYNELTITFLITFFIIYLAFTSYLLITFVTILKSKNEFKPDVNGEQV